MRAAGAAGRERARQRRRHRPGDGGDRTVPGEKAKLVTGTASRPESAPTKVKRAIAAANDIVKGKDYCMGGGHRRWKSRCYDCSGTVSYALGKFGARVLDAPLPSGSFRSWGKRGKGKWMTVYYDSGHMFIVIAGLRLDTSQTAGEGPGWSKNVRAGFANVPKARRATGETSSCGRHASQLLRKRAREGALSLCMT